MFTWNKYFQVRFKILYKNKRRWIKKNDPFVPKLLQSILHTFLFSKKKSQAKILFILQMKCIEIVFSRFYTIFIQHSKFAHFNSNITNDRCIYPTQIQVEVIFLFSVHHVHGWIYHTYQQLYDGINSTIRTPKHFT